MSFASLIFCDRCGAANRTQARFCSACGQLLPSPIGSTISPSPTTTGLLSNRYLLRQRYMILSRIGSGGFGAVYKAADVQFGHRLVAVKEMSQSNLDPKELAEATEAFKREAMLLANLTHPNLPRIYEQFMEGGRWYLVMDFIAGETLEEHLNSLGGKKIPIERALDIALQLCTVLDYLHTRQPPIIFRDLKPANVMLSRDGHVYLIDFGIARHFKPGQAKDTTALGSSGYAAPEQYGRTQSTARSDIYGLGATLHQLLTGNDPSESPFQFAPIQLPPQFASTGLDRLVMSMVSVDINKRPASVAAVKKELQRIVTHYTTVQLSPSSGGVPPMYQPPAQATLGPLPPLKPARRSSPPRVVPQLNTLYVCLGHSSRVTAVAWSPNGKYIASASYDKTVRIWDATQGQHVLTYKGHFARVNAVAWSPDSKRIASASDDKSVQLWEVTTGKLIYTYHGHSEPVRAVAWSPDGVYIASAGEDKTVQVWRVHTGVPLFTYREHANKINAVAWSPDGRRIASAGQDRRVHIWNPLKDTRPRSLLGTFTSMLSLNASQKMLSGHHGQIFALAWSPDNRHVASASSDHRVLVWDTLGNRITFSQGASSSSMKNAVAWSPQGKYLAIASNDKMVQLWNTASNKIALTYSGHTGYVMAVAWSPDGTRVTSAGVDRTVQVWQAV